MRHRPGGPIQHRAFAFAIAAASLGSTTCTSEPPAAPPFSYPDITLRAVPDPVLVPRGDTVTVSLGSSQHLGFDQARWTVCCDLPGGVSILGMRDAPYPEGFWRPARDEARVLSIRVAVDADAARDTATVEIRGHDGFIFASGSFFLTSASDADAEYPLTELDVCDGQSGRLLELSPDGTRLVVGCQPPSGLVVFDTEAGAVVASVPTALASDMALSPDGRFAYLSTGDESGGRLLVVYLVAPAVVATIELDRWAGETTSLDVSPGGARAYVASRGGPSDHVAVVDLNARSLIDTVHVFQESDRYVDGVVVHPDGRSVYVMGSTGGQPYSMLVMDVAAGRIVDTVAVAARVAKVAPDGSFLLAAGVGRMWIIDTATNEVVDSISASSWDFDISSSGAFVALRQERSVEIYDLAGDTLVDRVSVGLGASDIVLSPDDARAYLTGGMPGGRRLTIVDLSRLAELFD